MTGNIGDVSKPLHRGKKPGGGLDSERQDPELLWEKYVQAFMGD